MIQDNITLNKNGSIKTEFYKGDDFNSFGLTGIQINAKNIPEGIIISKAELRVGKVVVTFYDPQFPLYWAPTKEITEQLDYANECYLAVYDQEGLKRTCQGHFTFICKDKVV